MLHEHRCIGEDRGGTAGQQAISGAVEAPLGLGPWGGCVLGARAQQGRPPSPADIDECGTEMAHCRANQFCVNTEGSYECRGEREVRGFPCRWPTCPSRPRPLLSGRGL